MVLLFLAVCCVLLSLAAVFVFTTSSEGYSCGTVIDPTPAGVDSRYGSAGCARYFRQMWGGALAFMGIALVLATVGTAMVVATSPKRRRQTSMSENV